MNEYVKKVSEQTGKDLNDTLAQMKKIKKLFGITFKEYYNNEMFLMPEGKLEKEALKLQMKKEKRKETFDNAIKNSGFTKEHIIDEIKRINARGIKTININYYDKFRLYELNDEELDKTLILLNERDALAETIKNDIKALDEGEKSYDDIIPKIETFKAMLANLMTPEFSQRLLNIYRKGRNYSDDIEVNDILIDMEATRLLLGFSFSEYMAFHFDSKTLAEKREYMPNKERIAVLRQYNDETGCDLLDNKAECYKILKKQFGRKQVYIGGKENLKDFKRFCRFRKCFVKKALAKSMGKGVEPIYIDRGTDLDKLFHRLLDESGSFVAEEMIKQHECMKVFNPSSVNTVRIETFFDGHSVELVDAFIRFGQTGAFVDNAGAGGIFVSVDPEEGTLRGHGFDELGKIYETHPQSGLRFKGHELNEWDKAIELAKSIGNKFSGVSFIGWDIAYTESGKWVVVEGNAKPQIICNQTSQGRGLKQEFLKKTKYSEK